MRIIVTCLFSHRSSKSRLNKAAKGIPLGSNPHIAIGLYKNKERLTHPKNTRSNSMRIIVTCLFSLFHFFLSSLRLPLCLLTLRLHCFCQTFLSFHQPLYGLQQLLAFAALFLHYSVARFFYLSLQLCLFYLFHSSQRVLPPVLGLCFFDFLES